MYEQISKWDGVLPKVAGSDSGLMINVPIEDDGSSAAASQPDTVQPTEAQGE